MSKRTTIQGICLLGLLAVIAVLLLHQPHKHHQSNEDFFSYQQGPIAKPDSRVPELYAAVRGKDYRTVVFLVSGGVDVNACCNDYQLLYYAIANHDLRITKYLIDNNACVEHMKGRRRVDLLYEAGKDHDFALFDLVVSRANSHDAPHHYSEALQQIMRYDDIELVKFLLKKGADVNYGDTWTVTPLHIVQSVAVAKVLLEHGANVSATDEYGDTPLHYAVRDKRVDFVKLLLAHHANYTLANKKGLTALDIAKKNGLAHLFPSQP
jgi:ankyrin repeat protein